MVEKFLEGSRPIEEIRDEYICNLIDALRFFTGKVAEQQLQPKVPSHEFVSAVTGLVFQILTDRLPRELIAFSKHAGRKVIKPDDLFLYCRKTSLKNHLTEYYSSIAVQKKATRQRKATTSTDNLD